MIMRARKALTEEESPASGIMGSTVGRKGVSGNSPMDSLLNLRFNSTVFLVWLIFKTVSTTLPA